MKIFYHILLQKTIQTTQFSLLNKNKMNNYAFYFNKTAVEKHLKIPNSRLYDFTHHFQGNSEALLLQG